VFLTASAYRIYMRQSLEIRWRRALTAHYIDRWVGPQAYLQPELHRGAIDNPDQRIQEDVRDFVASALGLRCR
jgi:putative ATP-binding cassette transporter